MNNRRRLIITLGAGALAMPFTAIAQQPAPGIHRIGFLGARSRSTSTNPDITYDAFIQGMRDLGYVEGKNLYIEWRFADGKSERLPELAAELVRQRVEIIVTHATPPTLAAKAATSTIPIVFSSVTDSVRRGIAMSLARPGGNVTGVANFALELLDKQLELLQEIIPKLSRVGIFWNPVGFSAQAISTMQDGITNASAKLRIKLFLVSTSNLEEIARGFAEMAKNHIEAVILRAVPFYFSLMRQIADLASKNRLPTVFWTRQFTEAGGLMSYGDNTTDGYRTAANYVDKILKGANPAELPIEQPTKVELFINLKTAKALGIRIPQSILVRADRLIE